MTSLIERLKRGERPTLASLAKGNSRLGKLLQQEGVPRTPELARVLALAIRDWPNEPDTAVLVEGLTEMFRTANGTQKLYGQQAAALGYIHDLRGGFFPIKVGDGKTLVAYLAGLAADCKRPLVLVPGEMLKDTKDKHDELAEHWQRHPAMMVESYNLLAHPRHEELLFKLSPDIICADEAQALKNLLAVGGKTPGCVRRVMRYIAATGCIFVALSGTLIDDRDILEYHHLMRWALREYMPLPGPREEAQVWGRALDADTPISAQMALGALEVFGKDRTSAREGLVKRIFSAPGVVMTRGIGCGASLRCEVRTWKGQHPCRELISGVWQGKHPHGHDIDEDHRHEIIAQLDQGFFYYDDPPPPQWWRDALKRWKRVVALMLDQQLPGLDTEGQVEDACARGDIKSKDYERWRMVRDMHQAVRCTCWVSTAMMDRAVAETEPGTIIWTHYKAPGQYIRKAHGLRYFDDHASDEHGTIETAKGATCVASIESCSTGRNLQAWHRNAVLLPLQDVGLAEQMMGRTHRNGQKADTVYFRWYAFTRESAVKIERLRQRAALVKGSGKPRVLVADWITPEASRG